MKKLLCVCILCMLLTIGCAGNANPTLPFAPTPSPSPLPTPEPTPVPFNVLCIVDALEEDVPEFVAAVHESAQAYGWVLKVVEAPGGFDATVGKGGYEGILALRTQPHNSIRVFATMAGTGVAVAMADLYPEQTPPEGVAYAAYAENDLPGLVLDTAINYPPHDTPVRMFALLNAKGSPADIAYQSGIGAGKVFDRATYYADGKQGCRSFLEEALQDWPAGMVDAIYVETMDMAIEALNILRAHGREDMEVFCIPGRNMQQQRMLYQKYVYPIAFGPNLTEQAALLANELNAQLMGDSPNMWTFHTLVEHMQAAQE